MDFVKLMGGWNGLTRLPGLMQRGKKVQYCHSDRHDSFQDFSVSCPVLSEERGNDRVGDEEAVFRYTEAVI